MKKPIHQSIVIKNNYGSAEGYVVDTSEINLQNFISDCTTNFETAEIIASTIRSKVQTVAILKSLNVDEDARGGGLGSQLLGAFMQESGADAVILLCDQQQSQAKGFLLQTFYQGFDFDYVAHAPEGPLMVFPCELAEEIRENILKALVDVKNNIGDVYLVGGAVRDEMLELPVKDRDFVVVGSTAAAMDSHGFKPVGKDFPVFLHPETKEEYALARTERKSGHGYKGFTVYAEQDVTLEQDLGRRDLTINAMAQNGKGELIDPFNGKADLENKVLRHVNAASFKEDPVRILRLARFAARYSEFEIAADTMQLVKEMVALGEVSHLVPERLWQELTKGLMEDSPGRMFEVLHEVGALNVLLPELDCLWGTPQPEKFHPEIDTGIHTILVVNQAAKVNASLEVRFAALLHDLGKGLTPKELLPAHHDHENIGMDAIKNVCDRFKVPASCRDLAMMVGREHTRVHKAFELTNSSMVKLLMRVDAIRRPERFFDFLKACECDARGRLGFEDRAYPQADFLKAALQLVSSVDAGAIASQCKSPSHISERVHQARVRCLHDLKASDYQVEKKVEPEIKKVLTASTTMSMSL